MRSRFSSPTRTTIAARWHSLLPAGRTHSPRTTLGVKGIGEAATIGSIPAIANAVMDALAPLGVTHVDLPLTPQKIWSAMGAARKR